MFHASEVINYKVWPGDVIEINIKRPKGFNYLPGDYGFLNVPSASFIEWHPFTLSSSPLEKDHLSFHIKKIGNWTEKVLQSAKLNLPRSVYLDAPLGSPSSQLAHQKKLILIAAGIGVTPFISLLKTLKLNNDLSKEIYFFWQARNISAFYWALDTMMALQDDVDYQNIHIKLFLDSKTKYKLNLPGALLEQTMPNWDTIFNQIHQTKKARYHVFYCGPEGLSNKLEPLASKYKFKYKTENY